MRRIRIELAAMRSLLGMHYNRTTLCRFGVRAWVRADDDDDDGSNGLTLFFFVFVFRLQ